MTTLTTLGSPYTQDFDTLASSGSSAALPAGWVFFESGANANTSYTAGTGSSNAGDTYSFGATGSTERAFGTLLSGSLTPIIGASFTNNTGGTITSLAVAFTGEQWRLGATGRADRLDFSYSISTTALNAGTWIDVDALDFSSLVTTGATGALNGNAAANRTSLSTTITGLNIAPGATFWLRWTDFNAAGADDGLAIDDLSVTPQGVPGSGTPSVSLSVSASAGSEAAQTVITVTATASAAVTGNQTVSLSVGGTNVTAGDYTLSSTTITIPSGATTGSVTFTIVDDAVVEGTETAVLSISSPSAGIELGAITSRNVTITDNDVPQTRIRDIQGTAHISPLNGQSVANVPGIVTAVASNGFYFQDPNPDANPATSEGLFVFTNSAPTVAVGDSVQVSGTVTEFRPSNDADNLTITEIVSPVIVKLSSGNPLPAATVLGSGGRAIPSQVIEDNPGNVEAGGSFDPAVDGIDFWESLEGMRVQVDNPVTTSPTITSGTSEEIWVLADGGAGATGLTARGGSLVSAGDFNPERIQIDDLINASTTLPTVNVGATLSSLTGVVNYSGNNYEVLVSQAPTVVTPSPLQREVTTLGPAPNVLRVATFNVENLDPGDGAAKFNAVAQAIVTNLLSPDIINLEEVQDNSGPANNGVVDASVTLQTLIDAIAAAGGPTYEFRQISPLNNTNGGEPGGNIRVAFLFDSSRVSFVDRPGGSATVATTVNGDGSLSVSPGLIDPTNTAFASSRKPLVGEFSFNGQSVFVIGNHFNSKGGDQPLFGPNQPPVLSTEVQRLQQANVVKSFVQDLSAKNPLAKIVVAGDLNDFEFSAPITALESAGLTSLIETLPAEERYTYNFQGNAQALDHLLVSPALGSMLQGYDVVHMNSEFSSQVSDHDPVVASFLFGRNVAGTSRRDELVGTPGNDIITGGTGRDLISGGGGSDRFVFNSMIDFFDVIRDFQVGFDKIDVGGLLNSVGYVGSNPINDGYLSLIRMTAPAPGGGSTPLATLVLFDADGPGLVEEPRLMVQVVGVALTGTDFLPTGGL